MFGTTSDEREQERKEQARQEQSMLEELDIKKTAIAFLLLLTGFVFIGAALQFGEFVTEFITMGLFGLGGGAAALK